MNEQEFYTVPQVASKLGYSTQTIVKYIKDGKLVASQPGGKTYRISQQALNEFIASTLVAPQPTDTPSIATPCKGTLNDSNKPFSVLRS